MFDRRISWLIGTIFRRRFAKIALNSYLGPTLFVKTSRGNFEMKERVRVMAGARIEVLGSGYIQIKQNCSIGHSLTLTCTNKEIEIGENCVISANVFLGTQNYDFKLPRDTPDWFKRAETEDDIIIGENTFIGYGAVILGGTSIGANSTIGANTVVRGRYPSKSVLNQVGKN